MAISVLNTTVPGSQHEACEGCGSSSVSIQLTDEANAAWFCGTCAGDSEKVGVAFAKMRRVLTARTEGRKLHLGLACSN